MKASLLDRSRTRAGEPDRAALTHTIDRAVHAERAGFHRFWVAEHHAVPGIASATPAVLLAAIGARTSTIRLGSGGVMLPLHQPLVVAEQFLALEALHPGRVELGLGRSLGFTPAVRRALRRDHDDGDTFEADLVELRTYLAGTADVTARPAAERDLEMHVLATGRGLEVAARLGMPVVVGGPILRADDLPATLAAYRRTFRPHRGSEPHVSVDVDAVVADDAGTARELAVSEAYAAATARRTGEYPPLQSPRALRVEPWPDQVRRRVESSLAGSVHGTRATVRRHVEALVERSGADEVLVSTSVHDLDAQLASDRAVLDIVA